MTDSLRRAYQMMFLDFRGDELKRSGEWNLFVRFCKGGGPDMTQPRSKCSIRRGLISRSKCSDCGIISSCARLCQKIFFERIQRASERGKTLQLEPSRLIAVGNPLEAIIKKKMKKRHASASAQLSLVLYYERSDPIWDVLRPLVEEEERRSSIVSTPAASITYGYSWRTKCAFPSRYRKERLG